MTWCSVKHMENFTLPLPSEGGDRWQSIGYCFEKVVAGCETRSFLGYKSRKSGHAIRNLFYKQACYSDIGCTFGFEFGRIQVVSCFCSHMAYIRDISPPQ